MAGVRIFINKILEIKKFIILGVVGFSIGWIVVTIGAIVFSFTLFILGRFLDDISSFWDAALVVIYLAIFLFAWGAFSGLFLGIAVGGKRKQLAFFNGIGLLIGAIIPFILLGYVYSVDISSSLNIAIITLVVGSFVGMANGFVMKYSAIRIICLCFIGLLGFSLISWIDFILPTELNGWFIILLNSILGGGVIGATIGLYEKSNNKLREET